MSENIKVTAEQVKQATKNNNIAYVDHHRCSICDGMTHYIIRDEKIYYNSGCNCLGRDNINQRDFQHAADWINMQSNPEWKIKIAKRFGIDLTSVSSQN